MDANESNQTLPRLQVVKEEAVQEEQQQYTWCDEDRLNVSQFLSPAQSPLDSSPTVSLSLIKMKEEEVEEQQYPSSVDEEVQPTISRFCLSAQNTLDSSPTMVFEYPRSSQRCCKKKREIENNFSDHLEARHSRVIKRAEEVQASLSTEFPSFIKLMTRSNVTHGFWLGIPSKFCKLHMPMHDDTVVLEDERGEEYQTNFLVNHRGLSGGWIGFSIAHKLLEGDAILFHLVRPYKFKVYIVRANDLAVDNGALRHLRFDTCAKETDSGAYAEKNSGTCEIAEEQPEQHSRLVSPNILQENAEENNTKTVRVKMPCRVDDDHCKRWKRFKEQITKHKDDQSAQPVQEQPTTSAGHCKRKKETVGSFSDHFETQFSQVMERAKEVQASLYLEFPSFIRLILRSHVTIGYWLGLPRNFCKLHLPSHNVTIILEDESGKEYKTRYVVCQWGLSGGWKGFSVTQKLLEGDAVVFQLVKHCKFKVYIVRASNLSVVDRAVTDQSESDEENLYSSDKESLELSGSIADFENFNIIVNGITIDSMFSKHVWTKYYNLCSSRKSYLHKHLPKNIDCTLAVGIINETINISDAIRACKLSSLEDDFAIWDKTLKAFVQLGMNVGFLHSRLNRLVSLALVLIEAPESKRYEAAKVEREHAEEEEASLELKLVKLKQAKSRLDDEIETLEEYARECEVMFQEEANAPW